MPPEITETKKGKMSSFWIITIVVIVILVLFIGLIIYFSKDKPFTGYSDEELQGFIEETTAPDVQIYSDEDLEAFGKETTAPDIVTSNEKEIQDFIRDSTAPEFN